MFCFAVFFFESSSLFHFTTVCARAKKFVFRSCNCWEMRLKLCYIELRYRAIAKKKKKWILSEGEISSDRSGMNWNLRLFAFKMFEKNEVASALNMKCFVITAKVARKLEKSTRYIEWHLSWKFWVQEYTAKPGILSNQQESIRWH